MKGSETESAVWIRVEGGSWDQSYSEELTSHVGFVLSLGKHKVLMPNKSLMRLVQVYRNIYLVVQLPSDYITFSFTNTAI